MKLFRITFRLMKLSYLALLALVMTVYYSQTVSKTKPNVKLLAYRELWLQKVVRAIGLKVQVIHHDKQTNNESLDENGAIDQRSALWVANHISWMDIPLIGSQGVGFLSKAEVRKWPVLGWLGSKTGTVFINRGGVNASQMAAKAIADNILDGDNVLVFPEGTTGSGENVNRFHARIFAPALEHQLLIQPIAIQYLDDHGQLHPKASWHNQHFMSNLLGVLAQPQIHAVLTFLPMIDAQQFSQRRHVAETAENHIRNIVEANEAL